MVNIENTGIMSRNSSFETRPSNPERESLAPDAEPLEVIREEQCSPALSSFKMETPSQKLSERAVKPHTCDCHCKTEGEPRQKETEVKEKRESIEIEHILKEKEAEMRKEFEEKLALEIGLMKDKFDFILQNEEVRTSHMLQEAHRERQEKITALQAQLECKNLAGLMFVMCAERRKSKLEKLRLIEEYTGYIRALQTILNEGQHLILHLSRGYKTAARVDHEWREKMKKVIEEFQAYILHFGGGTPESNQYLIDLPALLKTEASIVDNPKEDPIQDDEEEQLFVVESETNKAWFDLLDGECRPFVMYGDIGDFPPDRRREVLKQVKAAKTAPRYWKDYVFNEMFVKADCPNADYIKDEYPKRLPSSYKWECTGIQTDFEGSGTTFRRPTSASIRPDMGSILKIISSSQPIPSAKSTLLAARDSMEIASTTKLRDKKRQSTGKVVLNVGNRKECLFNQLDKLKDEEELCETYEPDEDHKETDPDAKSEEEDVPVSFHGSINDSLHFTLREPDKDSKINYEKVCPMDKCRRMQMNSFMRALPPYMRASPFTHFEQTFDDYETCSPEQLEVLIQRIEEKKNKEKARHSHIEPHPLDEWSNDVEGVGVQTSFSLDSLPPCTCVPSPTPASSVGRIFNMADLIPVKQTLDNIRRDCFYDSDIEFDRFKVVGQVSSGKVRGKEDTQGNTQENFTKRRLSAIKRILKKHPSLCEIFQANTQC